jgi:hypothetical protein
MMPEPAAAHPAVDRHEPVSDRSMQILQYATAVAAMLSAALLAVLR